MMEYNQITKQAIDFQKSIFMSGYNAMAMVQDQAVSAMDTMMNQTSLVPEDVITAASLEVLGRRFSWPEMEERGAASLRLVYMEDESEQVTTPPALEWPGIYGTVQV